MTRRKRSEGSIHLRPDGLYQVRLVDPLTGRRISRYARTEAEALSQLRRLQEDAEKGIGLSDGRATVESYLAAWLAGAKPNVRPSTYQRYEAIVRRHIVPNIGKLRLRQLTPAHLRQLYADLMSERDGHRRPGRSGRQTKQLGARSVGHVHRVLHAALGQAARDGAVIRNVAALVSPPRVPHHEMATLDASQARALLAAAEGDRHEALYFLAVTSGARLGELLGLRWSDVNLEAGTIHIRRSLAKVIDGQGMFQEPKTPRARRVVTLTRAAAGALKSHRKRQAEERLAAIGWEDSDLVFPDAVGRPQHSSNFNRSSWRPLRERAGLPDSFRFHDLRHTAASLALAGGVPVPTVSEMLGHASAAITLAVYAHAVPGTQQEAADAMDRILSG